jgi:hypothetical protein
MPNTLAASPRKVASPITSTRSASPAASSGIDEAGGALACAEPKADSAPRQIHEAQGSGRTSRGAAGRLSRLVPAPAGATLEVECETGTAAAVEVGAGEDAGSEDDVEDEDEVVAEDVSGVNEPGAGSGRRDAPSAGGGGSGLRPC